MERYPPILPTASQRSYTTLPEPNPSFLDLLVPDINKQVLLKAEPDEVAKLCQISQAIKKICDSDDFWWKKAIHDTELKINLSFFTQFEGHPYQRYLRVLSYVGMVLPGSEKFLSVNFCFKRSIKKNQFRNIDYFFRKISDPRPFLSIAAKIGNSPLVKRLLLKNNRLKIRDPDGDHIIRNYDFMAYLSIQGIDVSDLISIPYRYISRIEILTLALQNNSNILKIKDADLSDLGAGVRILYKFGNDQLGDLVVQKYPPLNIDRIEAIIKYGTLEEIKNLNIPTQLWDNILFAKAVAGSGRPDVYRYLSKLNISHFFNLKVLSFSRSDNPIFPLVLPYFKGSDLSILGTKADDPLAYSQLYQKVPEDRRFLLTEFKLAPETYRIASGEYNYLL